MTVRICAALLWLSLASGLTACALGNTQPQSSPSESVWLSRRAELTALDSWLLRARIATSRIGWSGNLRWRQQAEHFDIRVSGPLGTSGFHATGQPGRVEIRTAKETIVTEDPAALLQQHIGWGLPLQQLRYWAVGVPYPLTPAVVQLDSVGRLQTLVQDGWQLEFDEYGFYQHYELPRRFTLDNGDTTFRVVVDGWSEIG